MDRAAGLAAQILAGWSPLLTDLRLVPATGGRFEVTVDDELIFSKLDRGRHAEPDEVVGLLRDRIGPEVMPAQ